MDYLRRRALATIGGMTRVECSGCGSSLQLPEGLKEGAAFACSKCGQIARNVESVRRFRWAELDPYVQKHGVSRANLWGGLIGSVVWIPALVIVLVATDQFDVGLLAAMAAPYLVLLAVLKQRRPRTPTTLWAAHQWVGFGLYFLYLFTLFSLFPKWAGVVLDISGMNRAVITRWMLAVLGASAIAGGISVAWLYRARAKSVPRAIATPLALILLLAGWLGGCAEPAAAPKVFSTLPYEQAQSLARTDHKLLLVDATATWCGPCQKMEQTTWRDEQVAAWLAAHAVAVQVDVDAQGELARQLGIEAMPTLIVFRDGSEVVRRMGYLAPDELLAWLEPLAAG